MSLQTGFFLNAFAGYQNSPDLLDLIHSWPDKLDPGFNYI